MKRSRHAWLCPAPVPYRWDSVEKPKKRRPGDPPTFALGGRRPNCLLAGTVLSPNGGDLHQSTQKKRRGVTRRFPALGHVWRGKRRMALQDRRKLANWRAVEKIPPPPGSNHTRGASRRALSPRPCSECKHLPSRAPSPPRHRRQPPGPPRRHAGRGVVLSTRQPPKPRYYPPRAPPRFPLASPSPERASTSAVATSPCVGTRPPPARPSPTLLPSAAVGEGAPVTTGPGREGVVLGGGWGAISLVKSLNQTTRGREAPPAPQPSSIPLSCGAPPPAPARRTASSSPPGPIAEKGTSRGSRCRHTRRKAKKITWRGADPSFEKPADADCCPCTPSTSCPVMSSPTLAPSPTRSAFRCRGECHFLQGDCPRQQVSTRGERAL